MKTKEFYFFTLKIILVLLCTFVCNKVYSQVELVVNEIELSNVITTSDSIYVEGMGNGPYIYAHCEIFNNTGKTIKLDIHDIDSYSISILYTYKKKSYEDEIYYTPFGIFGGYNSIDDLYWNTELKEIVIKPNKSYKFDFACPYLYKITMENGDNFSVLDYTEEVIESLPTLKVRYKDDGGLNLVSKDIKQVTISDFVINIDQLFNCKY